MKLAQTSLMEYISIHALLAESDYGMRTASRYTTRFLSTLSLRRATPTAARNNKNNMISIHALLAESDLFRQNYECFQWIFLSTLSLRRATWDLMGGLSCNGNFYPRSPCGERHRYKKHRLQCNFNFYPRSPCGERLTAE